MKVKPLAQGTAGDMPAPGFLEGIPTPFPPPLDPAPRQNYSAAGDIPAVRAESVPECRIRCSEVFDVAD
jgi:hypothetical protein